MKILFTNAWKTWYPANWLIALRSSKLNKLAKYSHCEFIFSDGQMFTADFSTRKCRFTKWITRKCDEVFTLNISIREERLIRDYCKKLEGYEYDVKALAGFLLKTDDFADSEKYFCSEVLCYALEANTKFYSSKSPERIHPQRLYEYLKRQGFLK